MGFITRGLRHCLTIAEIIMKRKKAPIAMPTIWPVLRPRIKVFEEEVEEEEGVEVAVGVEVDRVDVGGS